MITELDKVDFIKCKSLISEQGQVEASAIIEGNNPGRIFVDNTISPSSGVIWLGNNDGFIFFGNPHNEEFNLSLNKFIDTKILPDAVGLGLDYFEAMATHSGWNKTLENLFKHRELMSWNQRVYKLRKDHFKPEHEPSVDQDYVTMKVTKSMFYNREVPIKNIEFLQAKILELWETLTDFFNKGIGYCIVHQNKIVSLCISGFVGHNVHGIAIETLTAYQGKKLGQKVAHQFVYHCLKNSIVPYWDCMEMNKPSIAVAESIGFTLEYDYISYEFLFVKS
ncbi:GNAT family N-acetyltransferase [Bacillus sp. SCS-151]|uniref:GNAT family N-acetyltransferase n=1 Tax=Nanhaiella sioensis TaxID=3115293 RepID=UPI003979EBFC